MNKYVQVENKLKVFRDMENKSQQTTKKMVKSLIKDRNVLRDTATKQRNQLINFEKLKIQLEGEVAASTSIIKILKSNVDDAKNRHQVAEKFANTAIEMAQKMIKVDVSNDEMAGDQEQQKQQRDGSKKHSDSDASNGAESGNGDAIRID